jgi:hypothetical protein
MAKTIAGFTNTQPSALVTAVNTALALLTNPTMRGMSISVHDQQQYLGLEYSLQYSYDTGGAALGTPFLIAIDEKATLAALIAAIQARYAGNAAYFWAAPIFYRLNPGAKLPIFGACTLYNTTGGASANFATLNPGGAN